VSQINPSIPIVGQPDATEDPKIATALTQIVGAVDNVDTTQIVDGTILPADIAAQQAWQTVAFAAGFPGNLSYFKDSLGIVRLRGEVITSNASPGAGTTLATLPAGYRPGNTQRFALLVANGVIVVEVATTGIIQSPISAIASGNGYSFSAVQFRAEN
jgi:hypothetical protein